VLSNFSAFELEWRGQIFKTSEHAYHWAKFAGESPATAAAVGAAHSAHDAFRIAGDRRHLRRPDWDQIKVSVMREILTLKAAQHEYVRRKLAETGSRTLVENSWRDDYWGWGKNGDGQNMLGRLWMEVRAALPPAPDAENENLPAAFALRGLNQRDPQIRERVNELLEDGAPDAEGEGL